ncbi:MAG: lysophospholipid acyltransferase family protein [Thermoguttaceae bacterium]
MKHFCDYLIYLAVRIIFCLVQSLSLSKGEQFAKGLAIFFTDFVPVRRKLLLENLQTAFPEMPMEKRRQIIRKMWEHLFLMGIEVALAGRKIRDRNWNDFIELKNTEPLLSLLHQNRPVILVTGHFGNFELGGFSLGVLTYPTNSVARTLDNPFLNNFIKEFRESTGQFLISKNGGYDDILRVMENRGVMTFLADQSAGPKGCMVDFFGRTASTYKAIALLSLQFNAPIVVCYSLRRETESGRFEPMQFTMNIVEILDPLDLPSDTQNVKEITQWFTKQLEAGIRKHPTQYWWLHNRWKDAKNAKVKIPMPQITQNSMENETAEQ